MASNEEEGNVLFRFDDLNNINDINKYTVLEDLPESTQDLKTLTLDEEDLLKLQDPILKVNTVIKELQHKEHETGNDKLDDEKYSKHHKNLKRIEYNDYLFQKYEIRDNFEELQEDLKVLEIEMNFNPKSKNYKNVRIYSVMKEIKATVEKLCHIHDIEDHEELMRKKTLCMKAIDEILKYNKFVEFKRSLMIKKLNKKYNNEFIKKYKDVNVYETWDKKFLYNEMVNLNENIEYDCESDEEEDIILLNLGNAQDIKNHRLKELYNEHGTKYGKLIVGQKELVIEPFKTPYFRSSKS